ncbi:MAG: DinB family protein [Planctomycetota bacterium]
MEPIEAVRWDIDDDLRALGQQLAALRDAITRPTHELHLRRPGSGWTVAQHVHHVVRAFAAGLAAVGKLSTNVGPVTPSGPATISSRAEQILRTGEIPRGAAAAPEMVLPDAQPDIDSLLDSIVRLDAKVVELQRRTEAIAGAGAGTIPHPILGPLGASDWVRFTRVHTNHHVGIVQDLLAHVDGP